MDQFDDTWEPPIEAFRVHFRCEGPLDEKGIRDILYRVVADSPRAPDEVEVGPSGEGWVQYAADESLTAGERDRILEWLATDARMRMVRVEETTDE